MEKVSFQRGLGTSDKPQYIALESLSSTPSLKSVSTAAGGREKEAQGVEKGTLLKRVAQPCEH